MSWLNFVKILGINRLSASKYFHDFAMLLSGVLKTSRQKLFQPISKYCVKLSNKKVMEFLMIWNFLWFQNQNLVLWSKNLWPSLHPASPPKFCSPTSCLSLHKIYKVMYGQLSMQATSALEHWHKILPNFSWKSLINWWIIS